MGREGEKKGGEMEGRLVEKNEGMNISLLTLSDFKPDIFPHSLLEAPGARRLGYDAFIRALIQKAALGSGSWALMGTEVNPLRAQWQRLLLWGLRAECCAGVT